MTCQITKEISVMRHFCNQNSKKQQVSEQFRKAELLASIPGGESLAMKAVIRAGTIAAYASVN